MFLTWSLSFNCLPKVLLRAALPHIASKFESPHAVVDPPRTQSPVSYLEPSSCPHNDLTRRHLHLLEEYFYVTMRDVVMIEDSQGPQDGDTLMVERH